MTIGLQEIPASFATPVILINASTVRRNIQRLSNYASNNCIDVRPHIKTHKSLRIAALQIEAGGDWIDRLTIIPNHICPCINLHDHVWSLEPNEVPQRLAIDARGKLS